LVGRPEEIGPRLDSRPRRTDSERRLGAREVDHDPKNPLTARVIVNRLWQHHFGAGIVDTPSDFGKNGARPTHRKLLSWLACELSRAGGGSSTSPADRDQRDVPAIVGTAPEAVAKDAQSRLLWRYPPRRLEAEALRDSVLFVERESSTSRRRSRVRFCSAEHELREVYTPKKEFGPAEFRRMIYQQKAAHELDDTFGAFDCPDAGQIAPKRNVSVTPLQALKPAEQARSCLQQSGYFGRGSRRTSAAPPPRR